MIGGFPSHGVKSLGCEARKSQDPGATARTGQRQRGASSGASAVIMLLSRIAALVWLSAVFLPIVFGDPLHYKDCGSTVGALATVDVSPCSAQPCNLVRGGTYTVNVTFTSKEVTPCCKAYVYGIVMGVPVPFPLPEPDGCKCGLSCPLESDHTYSYLNKLPIKKEYPIMRLAVRWKLLDEDNKPLFCWDIPVSIVDG